MKPLLLLSPGLLTSKTARQLLSALAMYKVFSSVLNARPLEVEPGGASGKSAALNVSITFNVWVLMIETELSFALAMYLSLIHISEPTRQAEISYAVFCLKKKKK